MKAIWRLPDVISQTGLSRSTIYQKIKVGDFPPQINLGSRAVGWLSEEVDAWITGRIEASRSVNSE
jgi:prophage regulatory protein